MFTRKRRKRLSLDSSSEDDDFQLKTPPKKENPSREKNTRSSERINKRRNRSFQMPSRDDLWSSIGPTTSPDKYYHLKPKKLVNNFTKENNAYNYDPNYTSGSESMDDFIEDDLQYDYRQKRSEKKKSVHRIKHRRTRVIQKSTDSDSSLSDVALHEEDDSHRVKHQQKSGNAEDGNKSNVDEGFGEENVGLDSGNAQSSNNEIEHFAETKHNENSEATSCETQKKCETEAIGKTCEISDDENDFDTGVVHFKAKKKTNKLESDTEDENDTDNDSDIGRSVTKSKRRRSTILESDTESTEHHASPNSQENQTTDQEIHVDKNNLIEANDNVSECSIAIDTSDDDNDSFIMDDDNDEIDNRADNNNDDDSEEDEELSTDVDDDSDTDDNEGNPSSQRKNKVRTTVVQRKKEREELFGKFREARKRRTSKENSTKVDG